MIQRRTLSLIDSVNPAVVQLLHTPVVHWLASTGLATITVEGRRSRKSFRFPVGYHDQNDAVVVLVSDASNRQWWRNFQTPWPAVLRLRGRSRTMIGDVLQPESPEFADRVGAFFARAAFIPRMFSVEFDPALGLSHHQMKTLSESSAVVPVPHGVDVMWFDLQPVEIDFLDSAPRRWVVEARLEAPRMAVWDAFVDAKTWPQWFPGVLDASYPGSAPPTRSRNPPFFARRSSIL